MKIAFVIYSLIGGGAERVVSNLSLEMTKDHDVSIILFNGHEIAYPYGGEIIDLQLPASTSKLGKIVQLLRRAVRLRQVFRKQKFDAIFTYMETANLPAILASKDVMVSVRDDPSYFISMYRFLIPKLYPNAKKVIAVSRQIEAKLNTEYNVNNTTTIYNMVDIERAQQLSQESITIDDNKNTDKNFILAIGRLDEQKGFDMLIESYAQSEAKNKLDLVILGEGEQRETLEKLINAHKIQDKVHLKGRVDNPFAYYAKAELFVLSSRHEGFPNILIEALACHCACIAFDCPTGPNEIIQSGKNGLLVEPENIGALSKAIDTLYEDEPLLATFRANANSAVQHLTPSKIVQEWMNLLTEVAMKNDKNQQAALNK